MTGAAMNNRTGLVISICHAVLLAGCVVTEDVEFTDPPDAANARYAGVLHQAIELRDGRFPSATSPDSAGRDRVILEAQMAADIDGDGVDETLAIIAHEAGGSGRFDYLAVVSDATTVASTRLVGDRVQLLSWAAGGGVIEATVLQSGDDDAACCPSQVVDAQWPWSVRDGIGPVSVDGRRALAVADRDGAFRLVTLYGEEVNGEISLEINGTAVRGNAGCNGYFGKVAASTPGAFTFGPLGATRMACGEDADSLEQRYLAALAAVTQLGFRPGMLLLEGPAGTLVFERVQASVK